MGPGQAELLRKTEWQGVAGRAWVRLWSAEQKTSHCKNVKNNFFDALARMKGNCFLGKPGRWRPVLSCPLLPNRSAVCPLGHTASYYERVSDSIILNNQNTRSYIE